MASGKKPKGKGKTAAKATAKVRPRLPLTRETWALGSFEVEDAEGLASAVVVLDATAEHVLFIEVVDGAVDGARISAAFQAACQRPAAGSPRTPARVIVPNVDLFALAEARLSNHVPVFREDCPLLDRIIETLVSEVVPPPDDGVPGVTREETQQLLEASERLHRSARERDDEMLSELDTHQGLRVSFPGRGEQGPFVVINVSDTEPLLVVFASLADAGSAITEISNALREGVRGEFDRAAHGIDIVFRLARDLGDEARADLGRAIGAILPVDSWIPMVGHFEPPDGGRPPDEGDGAHAARIIAALAEALPRLEHALTCGEPERVEGEFTLAGETMRFVVEGPTMDADVTDLFAGEVPDHPFKDDLESYLRARFLSRESLVPGLRNIAHLFFAEIAEAKTLAEVHPSKLDELVAYGAANVPLTDEELQDWPCIVADYLDARLKTTVYAQTCEARADRWAEVACDWRVWSETKVVMLTKRVVDQEFEAQGPFGVALGKAMNRLAGILNKRRGS